MTGPDQYTHPSLLVPSAEERVENITGENECSPSRHPAWRGLLSEWSQRYKWMLVAFASASSFAAMALLVSSLAGEMNTTVVAFWRSFVTCVLSLILSTYNGTKMVILTQVELKFHAMNALFNVLAVYLQFYAYQHMNAGDASAIIYSYIALAGLFGRIFLKETFAMFEVTMVAVAFAGVIFVAQPPILFQYFDKGILEDSVGIIPSLVAVAASISCALHVVTTRAMGKQSIEVMKLMFYATLFSSIVLGFSIVISKESFIMNVCLLTRLRLLLMALCGFSGYALMCYALSLEDGVYVALVSLNDMLIVFVASIVVLHVRPRWPSFVGVSLILSSSVAILLRKIRAYRNLRAEEAPVDEPD